MACNFFMLLDVFFRFKTVNTESIWFDNWKVCKNVVLGEEGVNIQPKIQIKVLNICICVKKETKNADGEKVPKSSD